MTIRTATPLSIILGASFALLLLSVLSAPIIPAIQIAKHGKVTFGVFGWCVEGQACSNVQVGYNLGKPPLADPQDFSLKSQARNSLSKLLIVHPIAAFFTLILLILSLTSHLHGPAHSPKYLLVLLLFALPTFLLSLLAFLLDILIFLPHVQWGGWVVLAATVLLAVAGVVMCGMRRTLVGKVARRKRIQENAEMNGQTFFSTEPATQPPTVAGSVTSNGMQDKLPEFATFDIDKPRGEAEGERIPLNPRSRTVSPPLPEDRMGGMDPGAFTRNNTIRTEVSDGSLGGQSMPGAYGPSSRGGGAPMPGRGPRNQYSNGTLQTAASGGPYGGPPQSRAYNGPGGFAYGGPPPPFPQQQQDRGYGGPPPGYRGGPTPPNGPGMFAAAGGLTPGPGPRRGPQQQPQPQFDPRGPPQDQFDSRGPLPHGQFDPRGPPPQFNPRRGPPPPPNGGYGRGGPGYAMAPRGPPPRGAMHMEQGGMQPGPDYDGPYANDEPYGGDVGPADDGRIPDEREEFDRTMSPPINQAAGGVVQRSEDRFDDERGRPAELSGGGIGERGPLHIVNDNEYIPPGTAWTAADPNITTTANPISRDNHPVELPTTSRAASTKSPSPHRPETVEPTDQQTLPRRSNSSSYYEDVPPAFDVSIHPPPPPVPHEVGYQNQPNQQQLRPVPGYSNPSLEELQEGQRSPAMSTISNFTSISQRGINPKWQPPPHPPPQQPRRGVSQVLGGNPNFELPGVNAPSKGRGRGRIGAGPLGMGR